ncbi:MAG TPA: efflux RND transporter permease subunit [Tepidisphaeraceae bacterium]|nr:efflux RND transporter permease subunit [Tepidisphaeraceae bacterium]
MIPRIIEFSIRNRWLVIVAWIGIAIWGVHALLRTPVDAIPDLSENQVIVFADWMGRSPQEIEDQVTYPLSVQLQGLAGVRTVRSASEPNFAMVSVIFDDKTDPYFARTRILERLSTVAGQLPAGVTPQLAPDANALGQIFWYTVEGEGRSLDELRAIQDFTVRYQLSAVPGVAEVASVGGFVREYQVDVDPARLRLYDIPLSALYAAIASSNQSVGAKTLVQGNTEYQIRGLGWLRGIKDLENVEVASRNGVPVTLAQLSAVQFGPEFRRSALEKDGREAVGGVVMMRYGQNPLEVTKAVKARIRELTPGLPAGVRVVPFYERTRLIESAIATVTRTLKEEMIIASVAILLILTHLRSAIVVCVTLPMAVLVSFLFMYYAGIPSNIMSLCGIAISIGILVDAAVVMVENATHELREEAERREGSGVRVQGSAGSDGATARRGEGGHPSQPATRDSQLSPRVTGDTTEAVIRACRLVGRPIFFSVLIMLISFLPVFALGGMEGKLAHPLAFTKSFAMVGVSLMAITLVPALIPIFVRGKLKSEEQNPIVRSFIRVYKPMLSWMVDRPAAVWFIMGAILVLAAGFFKNPIVAQITLAVSLGLVVCFVPRTLKKVALGIGIVALAYVADSRFTKLGSEFKPELDEGSLMDMPTASPRIAMAQAVDDVVIRDRVIRSLPEVEQVVGKIGRADTPTDPSPVEMVETVINLHPVHHWPRRKLDKDDAMRQAAVLAAELQKRGLLAASNIEWQKVTDLSANLPPDLASARNLLHTAVEGDGVATPGLLPQFDRATRLFVRQDQDVHHIELATALADHAIDQILAQADRNHGLRRQPTAPERAAIVKVAAPHTDHLARLPRQEEADALINRLRRELTTFGIVDARDDLLTDHDSAARAAVDFVRRSLGAATPTFAERLFASIEHRREQLIAARVQERDHRLFDYAVPEINRLLIDNLLRAARGTPLAGMAEPTPAAIDEIAGAATPPFGKGLNLWHKTKADVQKELDAELQVPGWGNTWTQPIQNRINMLATGVRTQIGVKVFGPITSAQPPRQAGAEHAGSARSPAPDPLETRNSHSATSTSIEQMQSVANDIAARLRTVPGASDVVVDQAMGKRYLDIRPDPEKLQRFGVKIADVNQAIETALGGSKITTTVEGRQRFPVRLRYARDYWQDVEAVGDVLVTGDATPVVLTALAGSSGGQGSKGAGEQGSRPSARGAGSMGMGSSGPSAGTGMSSSATPAPPGSPALALSSASPATLQIPLRMVADIRVSDGPAMIKSENGRLRQYVTLNVTGRDLLGFVDEARAALKPVEAKLAGTGMTLEWAGDFEHQMRTNQTLALILPVVLILIAFLLYMTFHDVLDTLLVLLAVAGALAGAVMFQALFGFNFSVIVSIGYIAALGMATQTGVIMLVYLRESVEKHGGLANIKSLDDLRTAVIEGAVHRLRPKLLTEGVAIVGLVPMLWATGTGAEIMRPMAAPVLGGLLIADEVIDLMIPVLFYQVRKRRWLKLHAPQAAADAPAVALVPVTPLPNN